MLIELHLLQNFAPSNLNRDDTNAPKDCEFGGHRRARISSQCLKRAIRKAFKDHDLLPADDLATRTARIVDDLVKRLVEAGKEDTRARTVVITALAGAGLKVDETSGMTQYLLFLGQREIDGLLEVCLEHWDALTTASGITAADPEKSGRAAKKQAKASVPGEVARALKDAMDGGRAVDLALFGRMLADRPDLSRDAASQVAHAISTNKVSMEFDFFTAVDDLRPEDIEGAGMLGTVAFNSACFYRYSNVDVGQLRVNLQNDDELVRQSLKAFLRSSVAAIPTGKQNSMAAHNPPSLVLAIVRDSPAQNLANAFTRPVTPSSQRDLVENSVHRLDEYRGNLADAYGEDGIRGAWVTVVGDHQPTHLGQRLPLAEVVDRAVETAVAG